MQEQRQSRFPVAIYRQLKRVTAGLFKFQLGKIGDDIDRGQLAILRYRILIVPSIGLIRSLFSASMSLNLKSCSPASLTEKRKRVATEQDGCTQGNCLVCIESNVPTIVSFE